MHDLLLHNALILLELDYLLLQHCVLVLLVLYHLEQLVEVGVDYRGERVLVLVVQRSQPLLHVEDLLPQELDLFLVLADQLLAFLQHVLHREINGERAARDASDILLQRLLCTPSRCFPRPKERPCRG